MSEGDFTAQAEAYARARPPYPRAFADELLARAGVERGESVAEVGAGTGIFTELLSGRGLHVVAIEPNEAMRALAPERSDVEWRSGRFDDLPLEPQSQAWVVAAQAFHWAEPKVALPEIHRVLRPERWLCALWNDRDVARSELLAEARRRIRARVPQFDEAYRNVDWCAVLTSTGHFCEAEARSHRHAVPMSPTRFVDLFRSHNRLTAAAGPRAMTSLLEELGTLARARADESGQLRVPYVCRAFMARAA